VKRFLLLADTLLFTPLRHAGSVVGSRHDLSTGIAPQVCEFCHPPHYANTNLGIAGSPLWNPAAATQIALSDGRPGPGFQYPSQSVERPRWPQTPIDLHAGQDHGRSTYPPGEKR
jgi:hypothetical protein